MYQERLLPSDIQAEEGVLGSILIDADVLPQVTAIVRAQDFMRERNRLVFEGCLRLYERHEAIDQITLAQELTLTGELANLGGMAYLSHLVAITPLAVHAPHYAELVARAAALRRLIEAGSRIAEIGYEATQDVAAAFRRAEEVLSQVSRGAQERDWMSLRELLDRWLMARAALAEGAAPAAMPLQSGYPNLDELLGGMNRTDLLVLGARPSMGKSALALNIAMNAARLGARVGVFSLEMSSNQLVNRILAAEAEVNAAHLQMGLYSEAQEQRIMDAIGTLSDMQVYFDDSSLQTSASMRSKADRLAHAHGLDMLVVDYLQLVQGQARRPGGGENRAQEISEISRSLKALARDLNIVVLTCSQLNRVVESRPSHRPQLSDLRDSGSIEQDADAVAFIFREDRQFTQEEWDRTFPDRPYPQNVAEIILAKHRHGPTGSVMMYFHPAYVRFDGLDAEFGAPPAAEQAGML